MPLCPFPQVPETLEELCETSPPPSKQPQSQTDGQTEAGAEGGGCEMENTLKL